MANGKKVTSTNAFENFKYSYNRLDALYMQLFEEKNNFTNHMIDLMMEMIVIQLVAGAEAYELDLTYLLVSKNVASLVSSKRAKNAAFKLFASPQITSWQELHTKILEIATRSITDDHSLDKWISSWLPSNGIPTNAISRDESNTLTELLATRNLYVHHRGVINSSYVERSTAYHNQNNQPIPQVGAQRTINKQYCIDAMKCVKKIINHIDSIAALRV